MATSNRPHPDDVTTMTNVRDMQDSSLVLPEDADMRRVPIAWEALEDAFENNAPEVHSYLHVATGEVIRVVDGVADPSMHTRIASDAGYLRVDPVSSREQYRWMERFIASTEEPELRAKLVHSIDGKGAFRRFKDVLMSFPAARERWFTFRSERLRSCMETWLSANRVEAIPRPQWTVPEGEVPAEVVPIDDTVERAPKGRSGDALRRRGRELVESLGARDLDTAVAFLEFLKERQAFGRPRPRNDDSHRDGNGPEDGVLIDSDDGD
jgi:hypothetical protein